MFRVTVLIKNIIQLFLVFIRLKYVRKMTCARDVNDPGRDQGAGFGDRDRGVCQSVRDETEAEALMGLETAPRPRRRGRDRIRASLRITAIYFSLQENKCYNANFHKTTLYTVCILRQRS